LVKFGNISPYGKVNAYFGGLGKFVIILFESPPNLPSLHPNHWIISGGIIGGTVE
jgi:hypothetical protein